MKCDGVFVGQRRNVFRASTVDQYTLVSWEALPYASVLEESAKEQRRFSRLDALEPPSSLTGKQLEM
jgi:hypothetical protein